MDQLSFISIRLQVISDHGIGEIMVLFCVRVNDNLLHVQRPVDDAGNRVTPTALEDHRVSNVFRGPSCLCAYTTGDAYTESAIYMAVDGSNFGEYVASCATGRCGYLSVYIYFLQI
jgi:hypothetical protein